MNEICPSLSCYDAPYEVEIENWFKPSSPANLYVDGGDENFAPFDWEQERRPWPTPIGEFEQDVREGTIFSSDIAPDDYDPIEEGARLLNEYYRHAHEGDPVMGCMRKVVLTSFSRGRGRRPRREPKIVTLMGILQHSRWKYIQIKDMHEAPEGYRLDSYAEALYQDMPMQSDKTPLTRLMHDFRQLPQSTRSRGQCR